ncbi:beta-N-acetylhexosaminidase [Emcibacter nanhaiensis]|uniref:beta-N-acetylhexosaminidase n=1 Tax=Emcibacter nanhaiensis TaxID=1505037 RepID=A0A501PRR1_9PROT|nr:beta-N-acetylhexosaminidase [Emcibacter nanhaiensis]TPD63133.1 beta-N-acetylhexosaminidase [Emcibacter nanhaiensis]
MPRPVITDCDGTRLTEEEKSLFSELEPFGFILFARNCENPDQVRALTDEMREVVGREDIPILIDQEGGRVVRLDPKVWRKPPAPKVFADLYEIDPDRAVEALSVNSFLIAMDLAELGITIDCFPLLDLLFEGAHNIIGDRSFGSDPAKVIALGIAACEGLVSGGVLPMIKHIPGHGRAKVDSHEELPVVEAPLEDLRNLDFVPFQALSGMGCAMTAHVTYSAIDPEHPATLSSKLIRQIIRKEIGFTGVLFSDDISMKALSGTAAENAKGALRAGCDLVLHCNASLEEREDVLKSLYDFNPTNEAWIRDVLGRRRMPREIDKKSLQNWLNEALGDMLEKKVQ